MRYFVPPIHMPTTLKGSPKYEIGNLDVFKTLKVAGYVGLSAFFVALAKAVTGADFTDVEFVGVSGDMIALGVANLFVYLGNLFLDDTSKD